MIQVQEGGLIEIRGFGFTAKPGEPLLFEGVPILKAPWDIDTILSIINEVRTDVVIETGTAYGGSALLYSKLVPTVITIEDRSHYGGDGAKIDPHTMRGYIPEGYLVVKAANVAYIERGSTEKETIEEVAKVCEGKRVLVNLDSDHHHENVIKELRAYADFVTVGSYLIVEDTMIRYVHPEHGRGPDSAVEQFLKEDGRFVVESRWNDSRSLNFGGYLRRVK